MIGPQSIIVMWQSYLVLVVFNNNNIIYKTFIAPTLEFRALYSYVNRKKKDKND